MDPSDLLKDLDDKAILNDLDLPDKKYLQLAGELSLEAVEDTITNSMSVGDYRRSLKRLKTATGFSNLWQPSASAARRQREPQASPCPLKQSRESCPP